MLPVRSVCPESFVSCIVLSKRNEGSMNENDDSFICVYNTLIILIQVIDIVKTNTRAILQRIWRSSDVDNLRLCRIFSRVFNRLLWSHGQGLWNCFSSIG
jgi:hypothetical protein